MLKTGYLKAPKGYIEIPKKGRFYNGHPVTRGELANVDFCYLIPPAWIKSNESHTNAF